jgi:hypothetical protein
MIKTYNFTVKGHGQFPLDMLRYDACWPTRSEDIAQMDPLDHTQEYTVHLRSALNRWPTEGRWQSFGWTVIDRDGGRK